MAKDEKGNLPHDAKRFPFMLVMIHLVSGYHSLFRFS